MSNNFQNFKVRGITLDNFFDTGPLKSANNDISFAFTISGSSENIFIVTPPLIRLATNTLLDFHIHQIA